jgi:hypothetical protein
LASAGMRMIVANEAGQEAFLIRLSAEPKRAA